MQITAAEVRVGPDDAIREPCRLFLHVEEYGHALVLLPFPVWNHVRTFNHLCRNGDMHAEDEPVASVAKGA